MRKFLPQEELSVILSRYLQKVTLAVATLLIPKKQQRYRYSQTIFKSKDATVAVTEKVARYFYCCYCSLLGTEQGVVVLRY